MANSKTSPKYNLEERTALFGEEIVALCLRLPKSNVIDPLVNQLVRAGTSVGANYCEADDAESKKDFKHKVGICKKESREAKHFLSMLAVALPEDKTSLRLLWQEAK